MRENPKQNKTSPNEKKLPTIEEGREEVIENHGGEPRNDNSPVGNNVPPHDTRAKDPTIQENALGLNNGNPQPLEDENISVTAFAAGGDIKTEEVDDGISPWEGTQPQNRRKHINDRIWYS